MGIFGAAANAVGIGSGGSVHGRSQFDMGGFLAQGGKPFDIKGAQEYRDKQNQQQSEDTYQQSNENAQTGRVLQSFATQPSAGVAVGQAPGGSTMSPSASSPMQGSQSSANDHTHEENNNTQTGGFFGAAATAVTGNPQGVGATGSQPQLRGMAGMAANKAARISGASNVASQNQTGQDMFGGQSMPGIFQKKQF